MLRRRNHAASAYKTYDAVVLEHIALSQAAGFAAIEIEDQLLPRRVEHHISIDNLVDARLKRARYRA